LPKNKNKNTRAQSFEIEGVITKKKNPISIYILYKDANA